MLKLGTVFSGIGSIEHALERLNIPYEISFACDNGDVNIFEKQIKKNFTEMSTAVNDLLVHLDNAEKPINNDNNTISIKDQKRIILDDLNCLQDLQDSFFKKHITLLEDILKIAFTHKEILSPTATRIVELNIKKVDLNNLNTLVKELEKKKIIVSNEFDNMIKKIKKDELYKETNKTHNKIISDINTVYERVETAKIYAHLDTLDSYKSKKEYIDSIYINKENSNFVYKTYKENYDIKKENFHWNASFLDGRQYKDEIDLFVGGSPCQSFSMVGKRKGLQDTRGTLFYEFARLIDEMKPKVFIYENVRGLLSHDGGNTWEVMQQVFDDLNYDWSMKLLNAKDFNIPQNRERVFVVGYRRDLDLSDKFEFPTPIPLEKTMQDFLVENVSGKYFLAKKGVDFVTSEKNIAKRYTQIDGDIQLCQKANQQFNWHGDFVFVENKKSKEQIIDELDKYFLSEKVKKYVLASGTKGFYSKPEIDLEIARPLLTTMHKMHRAGVDNYVTTEGRLRKLTPRECLRLMGFCDSFKIVVSDTQMYRQAGNSVVVNIFIHLIKSISKSLPEIFNGGLLSDTSKVELNE